VDGGMGSGEAVGKSDHNGLRSNYELRKQILVDSFEGILLRRRDIRSLLKEKSRVKGKCFGSVCFVL